MINFVMLVGLPGSGKSSLAEELVEKEGYLKFSSDEIRKELCGDINDQTHNSTVFSILHDRIIENLKNGKSCIFDATNVKRNKRLEFLEKLKEVNCKKICKVVLTDYKLCLERNEERGRCVPEEVIDRMYINFDIPQYSEGWDKIEFIRTRKENYDIFHYYDKICVDILKSCGIEPATALGDRVKKATNSIIDKYKLTFAGDMHRLEILIKASLYCAIGSITWKDYHNIAAYEYLLMEKEENISERLGECLYVADLIKNFSENYYDKKIQKALLKKFGRHEYEDLCILNEAYVVSFEEEKKNEE